MAGKTSNMGLAIGPVNSAGQAFQWAVAVTRTLGIPAESFSISNLRNANNFAFPAHRTMRRRVLTFPWGEAWRLRALLDGKSHVLVDGFRPLWGPPRTGSLRRDIRRLADRNLVAGLVSHGSDTRDPDAHMQRNSFSYFSVMPDSLLETLRQSSARNRRLARETGLPWFVSTPDLLLDAPQAQWLPLAIDPDRWRAGRKLFSSAPVRFLHAPSRRVPPMKGTERVDPVLRQLDAIGAAKYFAPERVPHAAMPGLVKQVDVVVDQLLSGSYGVAAVEAMAAGRLVIGNVSAETRALMPEDPPIVDASPETFEEVVAEIVEDPTRFATLAASGPDFVARWHNGEAAARALSGFLGRGR